MVSYSDLINKVQISSGLSSGESEDTLQAIIESLSTRLPQNEREQFAEQLPTELKESALNPMGTEKFTSEELYDELCYLPMTSRTYSASYSPCGVRYEAPLVTRS